MKPVVLGQTVSNGQPRLIAQRLTLSDPQDLKVSQGEVIAKGQILSDRVGERKRTEVRLASLRANLSHLQTMKSASIPSIDFKAESLVIAQHERSVKSIQSEMQRKQAERNAPLAKGHNLVFMAAEERATEARQFEQQLTDAQTNLELARTRLNAARVAHAQAIAQVQKQEQDRAFNMAQIQSQIATLEGNLELLKAVKAPFSGTVKRVQWLGQTDQSLTVELTISVSDTKYAKAN